MVLMSEGVSALMFMLKSSQLDWYMGCVWLTRRVRRGYRPSPVCVLLGSRFYRSWDAW